MSADVERAESGDPAPWLRLGINPEPEGDEGDALIAAISVYLSARSGSHEPEVPARPVSRWASAGRREAVRGVLNAPPMGWGRANRP